MGYTEPLHPSAPGPAPPSIMNPLVLQHMEGMGLNTEETASAVGQHVPNALYATYMLLLRRFGAATIPEKTDRTELRPLLRRNTSVWSFASFVFMCASVLIPWVGRTAG